MIDNISFDIDGVNSPIFFFNCGYDIQDAGYSQLDVPTVFFVDNAIWFHGKSAGVFAEDSWIADEIL